ncbi:MAG: sensor domain-containing protein [Anaerolineaceae bacterium]|nr:sensor domain-containing protein [Anaerolineaceae bacterium]
MINSIEEYLSSLKIQMNGCDPATIQDAMADAEEHLRVALENSNSSADENILQSIIEDYGTPEETAAAYRELEIRFPSNFSKKTLENNQSPLTRFFSIFADPGAWGAMLYMLLTLITGTIYFSWGISGLSISLGTIILIIGLPITVLFLISYRGIAIVEGRIVEALLGARMPRRPVFYRKDLPWIEKFKSILFSKHTWLSLLYMILLFPLGIFYFCLFITLIALGLSLLAIPIIQYGFQIPIIWMGSNTYFIMDWAIPLVIIGGILILTLTMHLAKGIGKLHGKFAKSMLVSD